MPLHKLGIQKPFAHILPPACVAIMTGVAHAAGVPTDVVELPDYEVKGEALSERDTLVGKPVSASQGVVPQELLAERPVARPGELLEFVPGLIATQHSGEGKANQYFLRGFNLDHGTDFSIHVDNMPVNMTTHGHGQGYSDLAFLIPELVDNLHYRKGPYYADVGDFSAAGSADLRYASNLGEDTSRVDLTVGEFGYRRAFAAAAPKIGSNPLLAAIAVTRDDGPWVLDDDLEQLHGLLKYSVGTAVDGYSITAMGYDGQWNSTDQIPRRAVRSGQIDRLGFIDDTVGGESHRYSLSFERNAPARNGSYTVSAYALDYALDLYSNFTYFLEDPVNGDQFQQVDDRRVFGLDATRDWASVTGLSWVRSTRIGASVRHDAIDQVGLFQTSRRERTGTVRDDSADVTLYGLWADATHQLTPTLRAVTGLRVDHLRADIDSSLAANSGSASDTLVSPKLSLIAAPSQRLELFFNVGRGYHSNDARGSTITVDPATGDPADRLDLLVPADGIDLGLRAALRPGLQISASLWALELESELVFVGDGGSTEASDGSERRGLELSAYYAMNPWLTLDADVTTTRARLDNGDRIPNAVENVASAGITLADWGRWSGSLRVRYLGEAPLIEDNSQRSDPTTIANAQVSYQVTPAISLRLEGFNLFDSTDNDITYFYASRLQGEPAEGVEDVHFHPVEPRTVRLGVQARF